MDHHLPMDIESRRDAFLRADLIAHGYTPSEIRTALHTSKIRALAPGIYAGPALWHEPMEKRHSELGKATVRKLGGNYLLGGPSAAALHGLPLFGVDPRVVHLVQPTADSGTGSRNSKLLRIHRDARPMSVMMLDGVPVTSPARAVVDLARRASLPSALVTGDAALHRGLCTVADLHKELKLIEGFPGYPQAKRAVAMMDARSESALESRSRASMHTAGIAAPTLQHEIVDKSGRFIARVDFAWIAQRVVGEADGLVKYNGDNLHQVLGREKHRGDRITEQGWRVVRWSSADLDVPGRVPNRIRHALSNARNA